jgi:predicted nucleotidyltransferase
VDKYHVQVDNLLVQVDRAERGAMNVAEPGSVVMSPPMAAVIRVLAGAETGFGVREIARLADLHHNTVRVLLNRLIDHGLVFTDQVGQSLLSTLNREHIAAAPVVALATLRLALVQALQREFSSWEINPVHASIFGSTARRDGDTTSDIDILLIRPDDVSATNAQWERSLSDARERLHRMTGNPINFVELSESELGQAQSSKEPIVQSWRDDAIHLVGVRLETLLGGLQ